VAKRLEAEGIDAFRTAIRLEPAAARHHDCLGIVLKQKGRLDEADAEFREAIRLGLNSAPAHNAFALFLATSPDPKFRDPAEAVKLARKATELAPTKAGHWNTLGVAQYRAEDWKAARAALDKSMEINKGGNSGDWFFLAMVYWQLGDKDQARQWYDKAVQWMDKNKPQDDELRRFRVEAAELLKVPGTW
jgi:Flp pilus assembly protein TadD